MRVHCVMARLAEKLEDRGTKKQMCALLVDVNGALCAAVARETGHRIYELGKQVA